MITALNRPVALTLALVSSAFAASTLEASRLDLFAVFVLLAVIQLVCLVIIQRDGLQNGAKVTTLVAANIALFLFSLWTGPRRGFYHLYFTLATLPFLILRRRGQKERYELYVSISVPILFYLTIELVGHDIMTPIVNVPYLVQILYWTFLPCRFLFLVVAAYYLALTNEKAKARINLTVSELRENVRTSRALLAAIPDMIFRVSGDGRFLDYHCHSDKDLFLPPEKLVGKKFDEVFSDVIAEPLFECVQEAIANGKPRVYSFRWTQNGVTRHFDTRIAGTGANDALMVVQDVSDRVHAQHTIFEQQLQVAASSKMASLGEMAGGIAHEINNPLAIIAGMSQEMMEVLSSGPVETTTVYRLAEKIDQTVMRISRIIRSLRFFARDGKDDPFELTSLRTIVSDTLEFCRQRFLSHSINLRVKPVVDNLYIECRAVQIGQVLLNLLNNAHDAVSALPAGAEKWIELSVEDRGKFVEVSVVDSGPGIPESIRSKILEPFFTTKEVGKGTGLGLSISKGIIESHHGEIHLDTSSRATRFVFSLPKSQQAAFRQPGA